MKLLMLPFVLLSLAIGLFFAAPAFAAAVAPADTFTLATPLHQAAPAHDVATCPMVIVEDRTACSFGVVVAASCPPEIAAELSVLGPRLLASDQFLATCLGRPSGAPPPT